VQGAGSIADDDELVDIEPYGQAPDGVVGLDALLAQLSHLAEHRDGPAPAGAAERDERLQCGLHGVGVGVVRVVDDEHSVGALGGLHAPPRAGSGRGQSRGHSFEPQAGGERHRPPPRQH
jgi:hypothetical protein